MDKQNRTQILSCSKKSTLCVPDTSDNEFLSRNRLTRVFVASNRKWTCVRMPLESAFSKLEWARAVMTFLDLMDGIAFIREIRERKNGRITLSRFASYYFQGVTIFICIFICTLVPPFMHANLGLQVALDLQKLAIDY